MEELYEAYTALYSGLFGWLVRFIDTDKARQLARRGCANFVQGAMYLQPSQDGPWADAHRSVLKGLQFEVAMNGGGPPSWPLSLVDVPDDVVLHEVNHLYSAIYHATLDAKLTLVERDLVRALAAQFDPITAPAEAYNALIGWAQPEAAVLRRMVATAASACTHSDLVCLVAETAWRQEDQRSYYWAKRRPWEREQG
jgi:hypothetical protein